MNDCRPVVERLPAYVDGHLGADDRQSVDRHLAACPACRALAVSERAGHTLLRHHASHLLSEPVPAGLRSRCEVLARVSGSPSKGVSLWLRARPVPVLVAVVVMVFAASAVFSIATRSSEGLLAAQLTADHAKCFRFFAPPAGTTVDAGSVERQLATEYGWKVHVPASSAADDIQLVGVRRCLYGEGLVPHLLYRVHGEDVSLFVLQGVARKTAELVTLGHRSEIWSRDGTTFVLVSPLGTPGLARAARYVRGEAR